MTAQSDNCSIFAPKAKIDVFISYTRRDAEFVRMLSEYFCSLDISAWFDADIEKGGIWREEIVKAIHEARLFVLVFSSATAGSSEVAKELAVAAHCKQRIIPIRIDETVPTGSMLYEMARLNWIDAFPATDNRLDEIAIAIRNLLQSGADDQAERQLAQTLDARSFNQRWVSVFTRSSQSLAILIFVVSTLAFVVYDMTTAFMSEQAAAGMPTLSSIGQGAFVVSVGSPVLLVESLRHFDRPLAWLIAILAATNSLAILFLCRNVFNSVRRKLLFVWLGCLRYRKGN